MFLVPMLPLLVFLGVGMHSTWKRGRLSTVARPLGWLAVAAAVLAVLIAVAGYKHVHWVGLLGFTAGIWIIFSALLDPVQRWRQRRVIAVLRCRLALLELRLRANIRSGQSLVAVTIIDGGLRGFAYCFARHWGLRSMGLF